MKRFHPPRSSDRELTKVVKKIYDDLNAIAKPIQSEKRSNKKAEQSEFRFVRDRSKNEYAIEVLFPGEGWVRFSSNNSDGSDQQMQFDNSSSSDDSAELGVSITVDTIMFRMFSALYDIVTTQRLTGVITTIPISRAVSLQDGQKISIIEAYDMKIYEFTVNGDQADTQSVEVVSTDLGLSAMAKGSFFDADFNQITTAVLLSKYSAKMLSRANGIGVTTADISGSVTSIPVHMWTQVRYGETMALIPEEVVDPLPITIGGTAGDVYDAGAQVLPLQDLLTLEGVVPAGTLISISGVQMQSYLHINPGQVVLNSEKLKRANSLGEFTEARTAGLPYDTVKIDQVDQAISLFEGQQLLITNKDSESEYVVLRTDFDLVAGNENIVPINNRSFTYSYAPDYAWMIEPAYMQTGRITVTSNRIDANVTAIQGNQSAVSGLSLRVDGVNTAIAELKTHVNFTGGATYSSVNLRSDLDGATSTISSHAGRLNSLDDAMADGWIDGAIIMFGQSFPTARTSGNALEAGDIYIDVTPNADGIPKNNQYTYSPAHNIAEGDFPDGIAYHANWIPSSFDISIRQAGLSNIVTDIQAKSVLYAKTDGGLAFVSVGSGPDGTDIKLHADDIDINGMEFLRGTYDAQGNPLTYGTLSSENFSNTSNPKRGFRLTGGPNSELQIAKLDVWGGTQEGVQYNTFSYRMNTIDLDSGTVNLNALDVSTYSVLIASTTSIVKEIHGIAAGYDGQMIHIYNDENTNELSFVHLSASASLGNKIETPRGTDLHLQRGAITLIYDNTPTNGIWRIMSTTNSAVSLPGDHNHIIDDVTELQSALDGKSNVGHTHAYDNYGNWKLEVQGSLQQTVAAGATVDFIGGGATTVGYSAGRVTITSTDTDTNTQLSDAQVRSKFSVGANMSYNQTTGEFSATDTNTQRDITSTPSQLTGTSISAKWADDHKNASDPHTAYLRKSQNLAGLTNKATARNNLDLGTGDNVEFQGVGVGVAPASGKELRVDCGAAGEFFVNASNGNVQIVGDIWVDAGHDVNAGDFVLR